MFDYAWILPSVGLPLVAIANSWLRCFNRDEKTLRLHRRVTAVGWTVLSIVLLLGMYNGYLNWRAQRTSAERVERISGELARASEELMAARQQVSSLQARFAQVTNRENDLAVWHHSIRVLAGVTYLEQKCKLFDLQAAVAPLRLTGQLVEGSLDIRREFRRNHENYYRALKATHAWLVDSPAAYTKVLRDEGFTNSIVEMIVDRARDAFGALPAPSPELERFQREVGFNADIAQATVDAYREAVNVLHEIVELAVASEYSLRLRSARLVVELRARDCGAPGTRVN